MNIKTEEFENDKELEFYKKRVIFLESLLRKDSDLLDENDALQKELKSLKKELANFVSREYSKLENLYLTKSDDLIHLDKLLTKEVEKTKELKSTISQLEEELESLNSYLYSLEEKHNIDTKEDSHLLPFDDAFTESIKNAISVHLHNVYDSLEKRGGIKTKLAKKWEIIVPSEYFDTYL